MCLTTSETIARGEEVQFDGLLPWIGAGLLPSKLPRGHPAPIQLFLEYRPEGKDVELQSISFELSRQINLDTEGLPGCPISDLYSTAKSAKRLCAGSLVGHGSVRSEVPAPGQPAAQVRRGLLAFYDKVGSRRYILAQVTSGLSNPPDLRDPVSNRSGQRNYGLALTVLR